MASPLGGPNQSRKSTSAPSTVSALRVFAAVLAGVFIAETLGMFFLRLLPGHSEILHAFADAALLVVVIAPGVWWFAVRPLRSAAAEALQKSEKRYHSLFENMLEGYAYCRVLFDHDKPYDFVYLDVNHAFGELTGLKHVVGKKVSDVIPGIQESNPELFEVYGRVALTGKPERFETYLESLGIWFSIAVFSPKKEYFVATFANITERKRAETERHRADERLRLQSTALNAAANAIVIADREGVIEWVNPAFTALTGYTLEEAVGHTPRLIKSERTDSATHEELWTTIRAGRVWRGELVNRRKDGTLYHQELTITPVQDERGTTTHFVGVSQDVTERRQLEAQLRQAQKMEAIGQLTGGIAHDFNNILSVILANAELVAASVEPAHTEPQGDIQDIQAAANRGAEMIKKLLGFSRQAELQMQPVNLVEVVRGMAGMLRRLLPESIGIEVHGEDKPVGAVRADIGAVEQIFVNLATNARDAMPDGGTLRIECTEVKIDDEYHTTHPWVVPGTYVCLAVSDTGVGMDEQTKAKVFEPFFTTKPPGKGTGLGMAMIYGLTKQHGGFVHVYSEPGRGTSIKTYFPVAPDEAAVALSPVRALTGVRGGNETILLAEDEEALRRTGKRILERLGYTVLLAADGEEALELYRAHRGQVDLVISDMVMPKLGGRALYEAIQREGKPVRFILATGYAATEVQARAGFDVLVGHLPKPYTLAGVADAVRDVLDREQKKLS